MKKFWVINIGKNPSESDIRQLLKKLDLNDIDNIISDFFYDYDYEPIIYLTKSDKIIFCMSIERVDCVYNSEYFGWGELDEYNWFINNDYKFCGNISLRKEKLKKINEKYCRHT